MNAYHSEDLTQSLIPRLRAEEIEQMKEFYLFSRHYHDELREWSLHELSDHPIIRRVMMEMSEEEIEESRRYSNELEEKAICEQNWRPYIQFLIDQGVKYAEMGFSFSSWYDLIKALRDFNFLKLDEHYSRNPGKAITARRGMELFIDVCMRTIGEAYLVEKKYIIEQQQQQQEKTNREHEEFVYIASHDLQQPLTTLTGLISLLEEECDKDQLSEEAWSYIDWIKQSTARMTDLIDDLLEYSRVGRKKYREKVDLNQIIKLSLDDMKTAIDLNQAEISVDPLPKLTAHPVEMKLLFQNLIGNAIKYRKKNVPPKISIYARESNNGWKFTVEDNGIGIDEKYKDKIFVIFKRLHTSEEYEGTGIGLAHCKKIVEVYKGKIWVESRQGEGSKFHFSLPEAIIHADTPEPVQEVAGTKKSQLQSSV